MPSGPPVHAHPLWRVALAEGLRLISGNVTHKAIVAQQEIIRGVGNRGAGACGEQMILIDTWPVTLILGQTSIRAYWFASTFQHLPAPSSTLIFPDLLTADKRCLI